MTPFNSPCLCEIPRRLCDARKPTGRPADSKNSADRRGGYRI